MSEDQQPVPSQDIDIEDLYSKVQPATAEHPSVAAWLVPVLDKHKHRIINLTRNSELGRLSADRIARDLEESKFPTSIHHLRTPQALQDYPGLQDTWAAIHKKYQVDLTQYVALHFSLPHSYLNKYLPELLLSSKRTKPPLP